MENMIKKLVDFASSWTLQLEVQQGVDLDGKSAHRLCSDLNREDGKEAVDFFFLIPEEEKVCVCVPPNSTVEGLRNTYGLALEEYRWAGIPSDMKAVCMKTDQFDLQNVLCREFLQHVIGSRADQFGKRLHASASGNCGGCGGG